MYHLDWSVYLFETIAGVIRARSGGKGICVLGVGRRMRSGFDGQEAAESMRVKPATLPCARFDGSQKYSTGCLQNKPLMMCKCGARKVHIPRL